VRKWRQLINFFETWERSRMCGERMWQSEVAFAEVLALGCSRRLMADCHSHDSVLSSFALFLKHEDSIIQGRAYNLNFTCYFVWVWNLVSNMKGSKWRLTVLVKRARREIVWFKGKEVRGYWRKLLNDGLQNIIISRTQNLSWICSMHTDREKGLDASGYETWRRGIIWKTWE